MAPDNNPVLRSDGSGASDNNGVDFKADRRYGACQHPRAAEEPWSHLDIPRVARTSLIRVPEPLQRRAHLLCGPAGRLACLWVHE